MAATKRGGTPATVALSAAGVSYAVHEFEHVAGSRHYGLEAAAALGVEPERVFKTLLVVLDGASAVGQDDRPASHAVAIVPVSAKLSLKAMAVATGAKRAEMCEQAIAERLTGYVVGGISPFGQKKALVTVIDETAMLWDTIFVSGGRRGLDIELAPDDVVLVARATVANLAADE